MGESTSNSISRMHQSELQPANTIKPHHRDLALAQSSVATLPALKSGEGTDSGLKGGMATKRHSREYVIKSMIAGGVAGCAGSLVGIFQTMRELRREHGVTALFQGHFATVLRIFPYAAIKFMAYEQFHGVLVQPDATIWKQDLGRFMAGSFAGMTSVFFTYPMDMLRTRMAYELERPTNLRNMARTIYYEEPSRYPGQLRGGVGRLSNFYRGFVPTTLGIVPYAGVSFWSNSKLKQLCTSHLPHLTTSSHNPGQRPRLVWWAELACGGFAGAIAQTVAYPLEVIRRRMQVGGRIRSSDPSSHASDSLRRTTLLIWRKSGFRGFFVGLSVGYLKVTPMTAISFYTYGFMKRLMTID